MSRYRNIGVTRLKVGDEWIDPGDTFTGDLDAALEAAWLTAGAIAKESPASKGRGSKEQPEPAADTDQKE